MDVFNIKFAQLQVTQLAGAGATIGDSQVTLVSFNQINGTPLTMDNFGIKGYGTIQPSEGAFEEQISFSGIITNIDGSVTLTGVSTVLDVYPYTETPGLAQDHNGGVNFCISNTAGFYNTFANKNDTGIIVAPWVFNAVANNANPKIDNVSYVPAPNDYVVAQYVIDAIGSIAGTKVDVVSVGSGTSGNTQVTTLTYPLTVSGLNTGSLIQISTEQSVTIVSVTVGGASAASVVSETDTPNNLRNEQWFVLNPPLGVQNVVITLSGAAYISSEAEALINVNQSSPTGATQVAIASSNHPNLSITTTSNNSTIFDGFTTDATPPITATVGVAQVNNAQQLTGTYQGASSLQPTGTEPSAITMQYTLSVSTPWVYTAVEIIPVAPSGTSDHKFLVSSADTTPNYAQAKLIAGSGITITPSGAGNETLTFSSTGGGVGGGGFASFAIGNFFTNTSTTPIMTLVDTAYDSVNNSIYTLTLSNGSTPNQIYAVTQWIQDSVSKIWSRGTTTTVITGIGLLNIGISINGTTVYVLYNVNGSGSNTLATLPLNLSSVTTTSVNLGTSYNFFPSGFYVDGTYIYAFASRAAQPNLFVQQALANLTGTPTASFTLSGISINSSNSFFVNIGTNLAYLIANPGSPGTSIGSGVGVFTADLGLTTGGVMTQTGSYSLAWSPETIDLAQANIPLVYGIGSGTILTLMSYPTGFSYQAAGGSTPQIRSVTQEAAFLVFAQA